MPKKLMQDIFQGYQEKDSIRLADLMKNDASMQTASQLEPEMTPNVPTQPTTEA